MMLQITTPLFVAGVILKDDKAVKAAPRIRWMVGHNKQWIERYCARKDWDITEIEDDQNVHR